MPLQIDTIRDIVVKLGIQPKGPVQSYFTNVCYKAMDKYVPKDNGDLRNDVTLKSDSITYEMPYAHYQYKGIREDGTHSINPENYTTPGTGPYWDEKMITADSEKVIRQVENFIRRNAK